MKVLLVGEGPNELGGALKTLVSRLGLTDAQFDDERVSQPDLHAHHGKGQGYFKRAVRWMLEARKRGYDALILLIDEDGQPERLRELKQAQQYAELNCKRAVGVAVRTFDAWMLVDEVALTNVCGCEVQRQPDPERMADPKSVCSALIDDSMGLSDAYAAIAAQVNIEVLEKRCSKGFAPFAQRVRDLLKQDS